MRSSARRPIGPRRSPVRRGAIWAYDDSLIVADFALKIANEQVRAAYGDALFSPFKTNQQILKGAADPSDTTVGWTTWCRPPTCSWIAMFLVGSGGGGGGGRTAASGNARSGGGGGGCAAAMSIAGPANSFPRALYLRLPRGGAGGAPGSTGVTGSAGATAYVVDAPNVNAGVVALSGTTNAGGGTGGGTTGGVAGGAGAGAPTATLLAYQVGTTPWVINGQTGGASGALGGNGVNGTWPNSGGGPWCQGAGGGSVNTSNTAGAGGQIAALGNQSPVNSIPGGVTAGGHGSSLELFDPLASTGGSGGGGTGASGTAGNGGWAGWGGGGGGGGGGVTGGSGGWGGRSILVITWF